MSKTLILLRHAKTERGTDDVGDRDRRLTERGHRDAQAMGRWLAVHVALPDLVLCSTAVRTVETLDLVAPIMGIKRIEKRDDLYLAEAEELLAIVRRLPNSVTSVMIVGHNEGLEDLARDLVGTGDQADVAALNAKFPTAGAAVMAFDVAAWSAIAEGGAHLAVFMTPRRLDASAA